MPSLFSQGSPQFTMVICSLFSEFFLSTLSSEKLDTGETPLQEDTVLPPVVSIAEFVLSVV